MKASRSRSYSLEAVDMALAPVAQAALRAALAAPVEGGDREAAAAQIADHLEIFLDAFRPPLEQADRAARAARWSPQSGHSAAHAVAGDDMPATAPSGTGLEFEAEELHARPR